MPWPFTSISSLVSHAEKGESKTPSTRFAFKLFRELASDLGTKNLFFSPSGVMLCLSLIRELASGETKSAIERVLETTSLDHAAFEIEIASVKAAFRAREEAEVSLANSLWLGNRAQIDSSRAAQLRGFYGSEITKVDFSGPDAVPAINAWVDSHTRGKIRQIVDAVPPLAALIAINAVYFKGLWSIPFRKELTCGYPFHLASGEIRQVPMMTKGGSFRYHEDDRTQLVFLPYKGEVSMIVALPSAGTSLDAFRKIFNSGVWDSWTVQATEEEGVVRLPRFQVEYTAQLRQALTALGMARAFDPRQAEFEAIRTDSPPVWIERMMHRAVADVSEEGTEAAAVTSAMHVFGSAMPRKIPKRFNMTVDRPFFVVLRDDRTQAILFMGWIGNPQQ